MLSACVAWVLAPPLGLWAGFATADLTPNEPLPLGGYTDRGDRTFVPGGDALGARCLAISDGRLRVAVVSVDLLTIPESLHREVLGRLPEGTRLMLVATHTHCAPDSQMLNERMTFRIPGIAPFRRRWLTWYAERIAQGVRRALDSCTVPVQPRVSVGHVALNRARRLGAEPDTAARMVELVGPQGRFAAVLSYSAHAVLYDSDELSLRADWPGAAAGLLGPNCVVVPGAIGDVSPMAEGATVADKLEGFASTLARAFDRWEPLDPRLGWVSEPVDLPAVQPHPEFARRYGIPQSVAVDLARKFAPPVAVVTAMRVGKAVWVGIPGEPTSVLGRAIRDHGRRIGFGSVTVVSHANGWAGYLLDRADYVRGGYEGTLSFYGPEAGDRFVIAGMRALDQLARTSPERR